MVKSSLAPKMEIAGKRKFGAVSNLIILDEICNQFVKGLAGITAGPSLVPLRSFMKNTNSQHTYIIDLSADAGEIKSCTITLDDGGGGAQIFFAGNATLQNLTSFPTTTSEKETICDDGIDNDNDVKVDAADEDCLFITSTPATNETTTTPQPTESEQASPETQEQQPAEENNPPTADAGEDSSVESGKVVKLNGDNNKDPDANQQLSYLWIQVSPGSPSVSLDGAKNEIASFKAPQVEKDTKFNFELTVKDGTGGEDTDTVMVEVLGSADKEEQKVEQQAESSKQEQDQQETESSKTNKLPSDSLSDIPKG